MASGGISAAGATCGGCRACGGISAVCAWEQALQPEPPIKYK